ncbi:MAG TPA: hypothetical protein VNM14_26060, partial [Planctomycetota bacterium]|nr:hypothetical protein [Planctomycetota bacterium]
MQQLIGRGATWAALLLAGLVPSPQAGSETETVIRTAVDQHFALMPESWRAEFSHRLAGRVDDPRVAAPTRAAILKECERLIDGGTTALILIQRVAEFFPTAAPPEEVVQEGSRLCAASIEAEFKNLVLYAPLSDEEKAARRSDLKAFERQATQVLDDRIVGDDRIRGMVAARVSELFQQYADGIGNPTGIFLNRPLPAGTLREVADDLEKSFPREKKLLVTGLTGDREADAKKLQESGVDDLIYDVVVRKTYIPLLRASWADQAALKESIETSHKLREWEDAVVESIRAKAAQQKIAADKLRAILDPPSRVPRPPSKNAEAPSKAAADSPPQAPRSSPRAPDSGTAPLRRPRWSVLVVAAA